MELPETSAEEAVVLMLRVRPILVITRMIANRIGLHSVLSPI